MRSSASSSGAGESFELQIVSRTGEVVDQEVRMEKSGVDEVLAITRDITERKQAERELRRSARIVEEEGAERRRLERNLRRGAVAARRALAGLRLAQAQLPANPDAAAEVLAQPGSELALALEELRDLARGIHPAILADRGLGPGAGRPRRAGSAAGRGARPPGQPPSGADRGGGVLHRLGSADERREVRPGRERDRRRRAA
jgi:hypothetical protein